MKKLLPFAFVLLLFAACTPRIVTIEEGDEVFVPSSRNAAQVLEEIRGNQPPILALSGRARAQLSTPGSTDRSSVIFVSDRTRTLLTFRNSLGIEAGKLLVEPDSVTLYNRIDQYAQRVSASNQDVLLDNGFYAVNMLNVLSPNLENLVPRSLHESDESLRFTFDDHSRMVFSKSTGELIRMEFRVLSPVAFSTYLFANAMNVSGHSLPRNIQVLSNDRRSSIYLTIQSYEVNPGNLNFNLDIPSNITIQR